ncbi:MAG: helix-turn-helix domain-containing protein [Actinomycetota bacterium]
MERIHVELDKPWLSVADICEYMDVSTFVVTSVLRSGELPAVKFGREWRVSRDDFENWINQQRTESREQRAETEEGVRTT